MFYYKIKKQIADIYRPFLDESFVLESEINREHYLFVPFNIIFPKYSEATMKLITRHMEPHLAVDNSLPSKYWIRSTWVESTNFRKETITIKMKDLLGD